MRQQLIATYPPENGLNDSLNARFVQLAMILFGVIQLNQNQYNSFEPVIFNRLQDPVNENVISAK